MITFAVGDVVMVVRHLNTGVMTLHNKCGIIKVQNASGIGVQFDSNVGGHELDGNCPQGYGYYVTRNDIVKMEPASVAFQKLWMKEWEPKLKKQKRRSLTNPDPIILIEE